MPAFGIPTFVLPNIPPGKVVQIVTASYNGVTSSSSSTYADTGLTATITPISAANKVLVFATQNGVYNNASSGVGLRLVRGSTVLTSFAFLAGYTNSALVNDVGTCSTTYLDAPATTSATIYKTQLASTFNTASVSVQHSNDVSTIVLMEVTP